MIEHYQSEAHMRQAHPYIANFLANTAILKDGIFSATEAGKTYTWNA